MRWRRVMLRKMRWRIMKLRMMMWRGRKMMMLRRRTDPKTEDHTLWELAQSKCTSTFQKSHCIRKFTGKMPRPRWSLERGHTHTLCEPEQSKCMSTFHKSHLEIYRKNAAAQKRDPHFVRASSIEMHVNMLQEPLYTEIYRKNAAAIRGPDWAQNADTHTHTHLLRNILSNYWCGMHRPCNNTLVKPDRRNEMTRREKLCEVLFLRPC